jgi:hypothetical protein
MTEESSQAEAEAKEDMTPELIDLNWNQAEAKTNARYQFQQLAQGVITAINEDAGWLKLVTTLMT